jgi:hypothetical protein
MAVHRAAVPTTVGSGSGGSGSGGPGPSSGVGRAFGGGSAASQVRVVSRTASISGP